jgi:hypothetical protein
MKTPILYALVLGLMHFWQASLAAEIPAASEIPLAKSSQAQPLALPTEVNALVTTYCASCHGEKKQKGKLRLDAFADLSETQRLDLLGRMQAQIHFEEMPPEEEKQPSAAERKVLSDWVRADVVRLGGSDLIDKLRYPDYGNYVEHDKLFSGQIKDKPFSPARRWLVSPQIFTERVLEVFKLQGKDREAMRKSGFYGVTNPFVLPDKSGIRDYDNSSLDGGHLLVMLNNVDWISNKQIRPARVKKGELKADAFENPKDKWVPKSTPDAIEKVILKESKPTDEELVESIHAQFDCVLQRKASDKELEKYLKLTRSAIDLAGNTEGVRQMLVSVLLESEFLYRLEFGAGNADEYGRKMLSPREASYAISYALGDRQPDAALAKAAAEGKLVSKNDYRREVLRLLSDVQLYRGQIDTVTAGNNSHVVSHPKIVRFFREFFGYPLALKVFKDPERSDGIYSNPDRGSAGTPGYLVDEADRVVADIVEADSNVLETLLTTDKYFVYHNMDNEKGAKLIAGWRKVYDALKDTNWKTDPDQVVKDHDQLLRDYVDPKGVKGKSSVVHDIGLQRVMTQFDQTFGKGVQPFTVLPWSFGNHYWYSPLYNLGKTPKVEGRNGHEVGDGNPDGFDYQPVQPFSVPHRKGILTHPSWLIAHSQNSATDPVRRGRWIREKLLAGRVPDVPITVDAQIPEDPHKTLRARLDSVTTKQECWKCHQQMNPLGLTFEIFDDFGRFRNAENLEYPENLIAKAKTKNGADTFKTAAVDAHGDLSGTGDPKLDGDVKDALDLIDHLAKSTRVRQSIIRHAFRFYMGRNEMLSDSQTLIDADKAYVKSNGSFKAVIVSLLTSDSFMYRK